MKTLQRVDIGIICALKLEVKGLQEACSLKRERVTPWTFYRGNYQGLTIGLVICGIGKVRAAAATQWLTDHVRSQIIINWGCAGGTDSQIKVGKIIAAEWAVEYDCRTESPRRIRSDKGLLNTACKIYGIRPGIIATADQDGDTKERRQHLWKKHRACACDWESAAVLRVAKANRIPALSLRVISDVEHCQLGPEFKAQAEAIMTNATPALLDYISRLKQLNDKR